MEARQILITLHNRFKGDWDKIYDFIINKNRLEESELDLSNSENLITILDSEYPAELKNRMKPAFVITKEQATEKEFEITFKVKVVALDEDEALDKSIDKVVSANCDYKVKKIK